RFPVVKSIDAFLALKRISESLDSFSSSLFLVLICISFLTLFNFQGAGLFLLLTPLGDSLVNIPQPSPLVNTFFQFF
ncbi:MAG: hypothetical protein IJ237_07185, partial [Oscillospiraceae bacterium]|nr:hypothetical protein [Oscillospiraceae bacterium]